MQRLKLFELIYYMFKPLCIQIHFDPRFITGIVSGLLELTTGVSLVSLVPSSTLGINVIICAFLLGFGGISILLQVWSIVSKSDISIKPYLYGKLLQGTFASIYTYLIIANVNYFKYLLF